MVETYRPEQFHNNWGNEGSKLMKNLTLFEVENQQGSRRLEPQQLNGDSYGGIYGNGPIRHYDRNMESEYDSSAHYGYDGSHNDYYSQGIKHHGDRDYGYEDGSVIKNEHNSTLQHLRYDDSYSHDAVRHMRESKSAEENRVENDGNFTSNYYDQGQQTWQVTSPPKPSPSNSNDSGLSSPKTLAPPDSNYTHHYDKHLQSAKYGESVRSTSSNPNGSNLTSGRPVHDKHTMEGRYHGHFSPNVHNKEQTSPHHIEERKLNSRNAGQSVSYNDGFHENYGRNVDPGFASSSHPSVWNGSSYDRNAVVDGSNSTATASYRQDRVYTAHGDASSSSQVHNQGQPNHQGVSLERKHKGPSRSVRDTVTGYDYGEPHRPSSRTSNASKRSSITSTSSGESGASQSRGTSNRNKQREQGHHQVEPKVSTQNRSAASASINIISAGRPTSDSRHLPVAVRHPHRQREQVSQGGHSHSHPQSKVAEKSRQKLIIPTAGHPNSHLEQMKHQTHAPTPVRSERFIQQSPGNISSPVKSREMVQRKPGAVVKNPLLKYDVVPPKSKGPTDAERKLEELTRQLELEMEENPDGEEFGE